LIHSAIRKVETGQKKSTRAGGWGRSVFIVIGGGGKGRSLPGGRGRATITLERIYSQRDSQYRELFNKEGLCDKRGATKILKSKEENGEPGSESTKPIGLK